MITLQYSLEVFAEITANPSRLAKLDFGNISGKLVVHCGDALVGIVCY